MAGSRRSAAASIITTANSIVMTAANASPPTWAILAIGYKLGVPFLPEGFATSLVDSDGQYRLYRLIANPDLPEMASSASTRVSARCYAPTGGKLAGPLRRRPTRASAELSRDCATNIEMMLHFKRVERPAAGVYGGLCVAPYHFKHFDELLADIGPRNAAQRLKRRNSPRRMPMPMRSSWPPRRTTRRWLEACSHASRTQRAHLLVEIGLALRSRCRAGRAS